MIQLSLLWLPRAAGVQYGGCLGQHRQAHASALGVLFVLVTNKKSNAATLDLKPQHRIFTPEPLLGFSRESGIL